MPKKKKAGKNKKNSNSNVEKRQLLLADLDGQVYGFIEKALGSCFFSVNCLDNMKRRCKARSRRMRVSAGDCVIIAMREFDDNNADIIYKYDADEVRQLQKMGILPNADVTSALKGINDIDEKEKEEDVFVFEDI